METSANNVENNNPVVEKKEKTTNIPKGMVKSGRVWKQNQTKKYK